MAYLDSCMNREKTREQMHIHRNTLSYRLDRIEEILGLRLNNGSNLLNLYLSNIIHQQLQ
jgi:carbohydrate diacid regulator